MLSSLKVKNFRIYWFGMLISLIGSWIQNIAQSWLIFQLTNSAFLLGLVGFLGTIPLFFLSLFGGVMADRLNKKNILIFTQIIFMLLAFCLAILTQLKLVTPWQIMVIALLNGIVMSFDGPTRQAIVVELVGGRQHLFNAIALNSAAFNSARIIGPAIAGILIASIGMSGCFYINAVSFLAVIFALFLIKINMAPKENTNNLFFKDLLDGLKYMKDNRTTFVLVVIVGISSLFGISYIILMPIFANDVLKVGVGGLGLLMSISGMGALVAALILASLGDFKHKGRLLMISSFVFSVSLIIFALSKIYLISLFSMALLGWASVTAMATVNTLLQSIVHDNYRGRVMSVFMFTFAGMMPFGNLIAGILSQLLGAPVALAINGIICAGFFLAINYFFPEIKKLT